MARLVIIELPRAIVFPKQPLKRVELVGILAGADIVVERQRDRVSERFG
jgi:hypothetical protein